MVPGFDITEMFPLQAKVADKFSVIRSVHHDTSDLSGRPIAAIHHSSVIEELL